MKQFVSIPSKYTTADYSDNLIKCRIRVMHDKDNYNGSDFSLNSINKAKLSLKNIPILAYIKETLDGEKDFDEHNVDISIDFDGEEISLKETYLEVPIGVIPSENNYSLEVIDGKTYVLVDGYIWKNYSNEALDILLNSPNQEKEVSMEIKVNEGRFSENKYHIEDYTYLGITVLGSDVKGAMGEHCKISTNFSSNNIEFYKAVEDLNNQLKIQLQESEVQKVENTEIVIEETQVDNKIPVENETSKVEELEIVEENIEAETEYAEKKKKKNSSGDNSSKCKSIAEETITEEEVEVEVEEIKVEETVEITTEPEVIEAEVVEEFSVSKEEYENLITELNELREFKSSIIRKDRINEVDAIVSEFTFNEDEISDVKFKAINQEISLEQFKKELFAIEGMKSYADRVKFSKKKSEPTNKIVVTDITGSSNEPYGDLFIKFKK